METTFRWRNWLSVSVFFFLIFGVIKVGLAIVVPATLHLSCSFPGVVFGAGDATYWAARLLAGGLSLRHPGSGTPSATGDQKGLCWRTDIPGWMVCHMCLFPNELCW